MTFFDNCERAKETDHVCVLIVCRDLKNIQRRNLNDSFADSGTTHSSRDSFAFKQRMSIQGQWASEKVNEDIASTSQGSKRTKQTNEITEEEDFSGNPQVRSKESES